MTSLTRKLAVQPHGQEAGTVGVVKLDSLGRVWTPRAHREAILAEFEQSSLSAAEFAKLVGVRYQTFAGWIHRKRYRRRSTTKTRPRLVEAVVSPEAPLDSGDKWVRVHLRGGIRVEIKSAQQAEVVAALVKVLQPENGSC